MASGIMARSQISESNSTRLKCILVRSRRLTVMSSILTPKRYRKKQLEDHADAEWKRAYKETQATEEETNSESQSESTSPGDVTGKGEQSALERYAAEEDNASDLASIQSEKEADEDQPGSLRNQTTSPKNDYDITPKDERGTSFLAPKTSKGHHS
jgi:hypothetical protein